MADPRRPDTCETYPFDAGTAGASGCGYFTTISRENWSFGIQHERGDSAFYDLYIYHLLEFIVSSIYPRPLVLFMSLLRIILTNRSDELTHCINIAIHQRLQASTYNIASVLAMTWLWLVLCRTSINNGVGYQFDIDVVCSSSRYCRGCTVRMNSFCCIFTSSHFLDCRGRKGRCRCTLYPISIDGSFWVEVTTTATAVAAASGIVVARSAGGASLVVVV